MSEKDPLVVAAAPPATNAAEAALINSTLLLDLYPPKTEWELVTAERVPDYLRVPYVLDHYRVHFSVKLCFQSLVRLHTETFNIWTHLLGSLGFVGVYIWVYVNYLASVSWFHGVLLTVYLAAVSWLLLCSASFHCFCCHSPLAARCTGLLDYSGIGIVILASQWVACEYALMCWPTPRIVFEVVLSIFTVAVVVGPAFKAFHARQFRWLRATMYMCLSVVFPVTWWLMLGIKYGFGAKAVVVEFYWGMGCCLASYGIGIFFYLSRIPERFAPGRFDIFFQSHQIWHLWVIVGAGVLFFSFMSIMVNVGDHPCSQLLETWFR